MTKHSALTLLFSVGLLVGIGQSAAKSLTDSAIRASWFHLTGDETLHTEVIEVLAHTGRYEDWAQTQFVPALTTGPTVVVPAALITRFFGVPSGISGRIVLLAYHLGLLIALGALALSICPPGFSGIWLGAVSAGLMHWGWRGFEDGGYYLFGIMGEGASVFYLTLATALAARRRWVGVGVAATLAILSKPILLLFALCVLGYLFYRRSWSALIKSAVGMAIPAFFWLSWMCLSLGFSGMLHYWLEYPRVMRQVNGGGLPGADSAHWSGWLGLLQQHLQGLVRILSPRAILVTLAGAILMLVRGRKISPIFSILLIYGLVHLAWWMALSPGAQARYLFPGVVALWLGFSVLTLQTLSARLGPLAKLHRSWAGAALVVLCLFGMWRWNREWQHIRGNFEECGVCRQIAVQNYWKNWSARPPELWSTSESYVHDRDLVLSAPWSVVGVRFPENAGYVLRGEFPRALTDENLKQRECTPIFVVSKGQVGIWKCAAPHQIRTVKTNG